MKKWFCLFPVCVFLAGCYVQSLNTFYTDDLLIEFPDIHGKWVPQIYWNKDVSGKKIPPWEFSKDGVHTFDEKNTRSTLNAAYFKIGETVYMDFTAGEPGKEFGKTCNVFWIMGVTPVHSLFKIDIKDKTLTLTPMNFDWIAKKIDDKTLPLNYVQADKDSIPVFTCSKQEWVDFLKTHAGDKNLFLAKNALVFTKYEPTPKPGPKPGEE